MSGKRWNIVETHAVAKHKTAAGDKFVNNYHVLRTLGQGRFAKVKLCERLPAIPSHDEPPAQVDGGVKRRQFAIKIFSKKALSRMKEYITTPPSQPGEASSMRVVTALDRVRDEIAIMRTLYHRNIALLFEVIESETNDKIYMVVELMSGGPCMVFDPETKRFDSPITGGTATEELAQSYFRDVLEALKYLHGRGVCHRDIKPDNILLNGSGRCHLTDFGCAMAFDTSSSSEMARVSDTVGTYQFLAPECCSGEPYDPFKVDVWATGVVLYIFLTGTLPFNAEGTKELFEEIATAPIELPLEVREEVRPVCIDLIHRLLERNPGDRISVRDALAHPWLTEDDGDGQPIFF